MRIAPKIHPVVADYCGSTDAMVEVLKRAPEPREPIIEVCIRLFDSLVTPDQREAVLREAEELDDVKCDPGLYIIFLVARCTVSVREGRRTEARALANRAEALLSEDIPPELQVSVRRLPGTIAGSSGGHSAYMQSLADALASLPQNSPRRRGVVYQKLDMLARRGELADGLADLRWLEDTNRPDLRPSLGELTLVRFLDCVHTGRATEAEALRPGIASPKTIVGFATAEAMPILDMLMGRWALDRPRTPEEERCWGDEWPPVWVKSTRMLWERNPRRALELAREMGGHELTWVGFDSFLLIRAELACGNGEAARRIIQIKRDMGGGHYLDDFFLARVELLAGNRAAAAGHFAAVLRAAEHFNARGRLDFELGLACELRPVDQLFLRDCAAGSQEVRPPEAVTVVSPVARRLEVEPRGCARLGGQSRQVAEVRKMIADFAANDAAVLITGETGTGKELVARALHEESRRSAEPFLAVNCGAIAESLLESELFGHEKGAFTGAVRARKGLFEEAGKGTIFLDEIGEVPPRLQVALLRVLETGEVRPVGSSRTRRVFCRVVAATNVNLAEMISAQRFRQDLFYRLARLEVRVPALRERAEDILTLADLFLRRDRRDGRKPAMAEDLKVVLTAYRWPGNVRELRNEVERMRLLNSDGLRYDLSMLSEAIRKEASAPATPPAPGPQPAQAEPAGQPAAAGGMPTGQPGPAGSSAILAGGRSVMRLLARSRELFRQHRELTRMELAAALGVSHDTATRYLKTLISEGLVEKVEPTASPRTHYFRLRS